MIPTLVIALREGVEAALIVGIVAAFLVKEGRRDTLRQMWGGVAIAVALCLGIAVLLRVVGQQLPQREQEGLETVIGVIAVAAVTYMIIWMRRHASGIKAELEGHAAGALAAGSTVALVAMAFLAVLREGFETSVFLLAAFQDASDPAAAGSLASWKAASRKTEVSKPSRSTARKAIATSATVEPAARAPAAWPSSSALMPLAWRRIQMIM